MMITKYEFRGEKDGISLLILAAVHGNETAGTQACFRIIDEFNRGALRLTGGHLTLVPVCNPEAYRKDVRCIDENLNRVIKMHDNPQSYEQRLANEICPLIRSHRFTLDLHSTHCVGDVPFAFCDYPDDYNRKVIEVNNISKVRNTLLMLLISIMIFNVLILFYSLLILFTGFSFAIRQDFQSTQATIITKLAITTSTYTAQLM